MIKLKIRPHTIPNDNAGGQSHSVYSESAHVLTELLAGIKINLTLRKLILFQDCPSLEHTS